MPSPYAAPSGSYSGPHPDHGPHLYRGHGRPGRGSRISGLMGGLRRVEAWLDQRGRAAWLTAMVLAFIFVWPLGLFLVAYMTYTNRWSHEMFGSSCRARRAHHDHHHDHWGRGWGRAGFRPSGNSAFDSYRADTLRRLEEEQEAFESFLQRLRAAKDKTEFDAFMEDRAKMNRETDVVPSEDSTPGAQGEDTLRRGEY